MTHNSREKLNEVHLVGSIGLAGLIAALSGSWPLFVLIALSLIAASIATGEIRGGGRGRRGR